MNKYKFICFIFALAGVASIAGTINHIVNTGENILPPILMAVVSFYAAFACYKASKRP